MKKKPKILISVTTVVLLVVGASLYTLRESSRYGDTQSDIKEMLTAHYNPGTCYGIPTGQDTPNMELTRTAGGWQYKVEDGKCCDITSYEGVVKGEGAGKHIVESKSNTYKTAC